MRERAIGEQFTIRNGAIGLEFTMRKSDGVRVNHEKEGLGESSP